MSMKIIELPKGQPLAWYLDEEVRLAKDVQEELFFCWTVSPTVIYGRHQQREAAILRGARHRGRAAEEWRRVRVCRPWQPDAQPD